MFAPRPTAGAGRPGRAYRLPGAMGAVLGLPAGAAAALVAWTLGGGATTGLVLAAAAAAWLAAATTPSGAVVAAAQCWACYDGFVLHRFGTLDGGHADLVALAVVAGAAGAAGLVTAVARRGRAPASLPGYAALQVPSALHRAGAVVE